MASWTDALDQFVEILKPLMTVIGVDFAFRDGVGRIGRLDP